MTAVQFVGAGPGAAELLTLRAARLLAAADVVLYPGTYLDPAVLENCAADADLVDTQDLDLDAIVTRIVAAQQAGLRVVRLVSGDPTIYSAVFEQTRRLDAAGVPWSVTPGVPAYAAAAARVGRELTVPLVAQSVVLTRTQQRSTPMPQSEALATFAATRATLVLHLAIAQTRSLMAELAPAYGPDCPVLVVYRASQPAELVLRGTVADIADQVERAGLRRAAVILVGHALADRLDPDGGDSYLYDPLRDRSVKTSERSAMDVTALPSIDSIYDVIYRRRDTRREFTGQPVAPEVLERVLSAAHAAPSVGMSQPWDFVLVREPRTLTAFRDHVARERAMFADSLSGERAEAFSRIKIEGICESGLGIVVGYDHTRGGPHILGRHAIDDAGLYSVVCAIQNLWLAATAEGLGVGWVSFYREDFLRSLVGMPEHVRPVAWLCVGNVAELPDVPDLERYGWRDRNPLGAVVHQEHYPNADKVFR